MKILIAYDGSQCSEAALDDLVRAGLPESCDAVVVSVAEVWLPPPNGTGDVTGINLDEESERMIQRHYEKDKRKVAEAATLANQAKERLQRMFPKWRVGVEATYGSPAWAILEHAGEFKPDLIVVGSHGRAAISRFFLGSISQKVLTEADCSVRVARGRIEVDPTPVRIVIGFDGSKGAQAAVDAVASRSWRDYSEIRLVAATEDLTPSAVGRFIPPVTHMVEEVNETEREWIEKLAESALKKLRTKNISASLHVHPGNPKNILVEETEKWNADCIFVGANAFGSRLERFLLGSTSAAVAARAHCSVEVVRRSLFD
ncbi:MAG: universal stress protein [Pyrinomonadaceae bacterium]